MSSTCCAGLAGREQSRNLTHNSNHTMPCSMQSLAAAKTASTYQQPHPLCKWKCRRWMFGSSGAQQCFASLCTKHTVDNKSNDHALIPRGSFVQAPSAARGVPFPPAASGWARTGPAGGGSDSLGDGGLHDHGSPVVGDVLFAARALDQHLVRRLLGRADEASVDLDGEEVAEEDGVDLGTDRTR